MKPRSLPFLAFLALGACTQPAQERAPAATAAASANAPATTTAEAIPATTRSLPRIDFANLVTSLSEPDRSFFSDNFISNETSYLQPAATLGRQLAGAARPGGVYVGVGPEQNFTYLALTRPSVAFIVDIRRENMVLHLLYKALFDEATSRPHFVALLVGRPYDAAGGATADAGIDAVLADAERRPRDEATFIASHARLRDRIEKDFGLALDAKDHATLEQSHRAFFQGQLDIRFELHQKNGRRYPTLRDLLRQTDPDGKALGFLASEESFRFVQRMQREHRIVPLVGDFGGDRALPGVAAWIREHRLEVDAFYVSNVEQYLFEPGVWAKWSRNVAALPIHEQSVFIRCYLDQGRRHPKQQGAHRTATTLHSMAGFAARQQKKPFESFWAVTTEGVLDGSTAPERTAARR